jgi:hypothetical protein
MLPLDGRSFRVTIDLLSVGRVILFTRGQYPRPKLGIGMVPLCRTRFALTETPQAPATVTRAGRCLTLRAGFALMPLEVRPVSVAAHAELSDELFVTRRDDGRTRGRGAAFRR